MRILLLLLGILALAVPAAGHEVRAECTRANELLERAESTTSRLHSRAGYAAFKATSRDTPRGVQLQYVETMKSHLRAFHVLNTDLRNLTYWLVECLRGNDGPNMQLGLDLIESSLGRIEYSLRY